MTVRIGLFVIGFLAAAGASAQEAVVSTTLTPPAAVKPWAARIQADHYMKHRRNHDAYTGLTLDTSYKFDTKNSVRLLQTATKYQVVNRDEPEFLLDDTTLQYTRSLAKGWHDFDWRLRPSLSLPVSRESGRQGIVSRPAITLLVDRKFLGGKLSTTYAPFYRYHINRYKTRISGAPLRRMALGHTLTVGYDITKKLSASVVGQGFYAWDEASPYANIDPRPKGTYLYDASFGYSISKNFDVAVGYSQSDAFIKEGRYDVNIYDPATSRYYLTLSASM